MVMVRVIWGLLVGLLVWWLIRRWLRNAAPEPSTPPAPPVPDDTRVTRMVACAHCGLHLPEADAICSTTSAGPVYHCSPEHARADTHRTEQ